MLWLPYPNRKADLAHYCEAIMSAMASQITSVSVVCSTVYSGADQRKHQSSASVAFVRGIHRWPMDSIRIGSVTWKMFPFDDTIMNLCKWDGWVIFLVYPWMLVIIIRRMGYLSLDLYTTIRWYFEACWRMRASVNWVIICSGCLFGTRPSPQSVVTNIPMKL